MLCLCIGELVSAVQFLTTGWQKSFPPTDHRRRLPRTMRSAAPVRAGRLLGLLSASAETSWPSALHIMLQQQRGLKIFEVQISTLRQFLFATGEK